MVSSETQNQVTGLKLSSVVPAKPSEEEKTHELKTIDLAMKLHYVKAIYFFDKEAVEGFTVYDLKAPASPLLNMFRQVAGRIRCTENGQSFIKCNDGGVRIVEARCNDNTVDEFLNDGGDNDRLVYDPVIGPDLGFSPLVFIQFTWFKCGGISIGLSWSHILGDAFSASNFINMWAKFMSGDSPPETFNVDDNGKLEFPPAFSDTPLSVKLVDPVGDRWITANGCKMATHSFHVTAKQLNHLMSDVYDDDQSNNGAKMSSFEILTAMIWKSINRIRGDSGPIIVTVCSKNPNHRGKNVLANSQVIATVEAGSSVANTDLSELVSLVAGKSATNETCLVQKTMEKNEGAKRDCVLYGANLTFVNLEDAGLYEIEIKERKPVFVNYMIHGVGDEGVVLVLPRKSKDGPDQARTLTVTLPETQLSALKTELEKEWNII